MNKVLTISIILVLLLLGFGTYYIFNSLELNESEKVSNIILAITCGFGVIGAICLLVNIVILQRTYIDSKEPALLLQVFSEAIENKPTGRTTIRYVNTTNNAFHDLTISCKVSLSNDIIDLSSLFTPDMYMGPRDERTRCENLTTLLEAKGHDIGEIVKSGNDIILALSFSYTFNGKKKCIDLQKYRWHSNKMLWEII